MRFRDRREAGRHLAEVVRRADLGGGDAVVLGLPRGGVPVAFEVARGLDAPLDVIVVRKLGVPFQPELAMGAIGEGGVLVVNQEVRQSSALEAFDIDTVASRSVPSWTDARGSTGAGALISTSRGGAPSSSTTGSPPVRPCEPPAKSRGRSVPLASSSQRPSPRDRRSRRCATSATRSCVSKSPEPFYAVGEWYRDFSQTSDDEVVELLRSATGDTARCRERICRVKILHCETRKPWSPPVRSRCPGASPSPSHLPARSSSRTGAAAAATARETATWRGSSTRLAWRRCSSTS